MRLPAFKIEPMDGSSATHGIPQPDDFLLPGQVQGGRDRFLSLDFVWSLIEAESVSAAGK